jgi:hypothetical protein
LSAAAAAVAAAAEEEEEEEKVVVLAVLLGPVAVEFVEWRVLSPWALLSPAFETAGARPAKPVSHRTREGVSSCGPGSRRAILWMESKSSRMLG